MWVPHMNGNTDISHSHTVLLYQGDTHMTHTTHTHTCTCVKETQFNERNTLQAHTGTVCTRVVKPVLSAEDVS